MFVADQSITLPLNGIWDTLFRQTWIDINILGLFGTDGFRINLIGLIVIGLVGIAATSIAERLVGEKPGKNLLGAVLIALLGSYIAAAIFKQLPFEIRIEDVPMIAALLGAIIFGTFYVLIQRAFTKKAA
jgi:uncharacterized membrane protein YeaQ/YmgE (transglycosylase-associated protein family)